MGSPNFRSAEPGRPIPYWTNMSSDFTYRISTTRFDENYTPSADSRTTTNFANLARGEHRQANLRTALSMIATRFHDLVRRADAPRDNHQAREPHSQGRYGLDLDIVTADLDFTADDEQLRFPVIEVLDIGIVDHSTGDRLPGIVGNNFSSYIRDYDFSVRLPAANKNSTEFTVPADFGELHGRVFQHFLASEAYRERFDLPPVICISVSTSRTYRRTGTQHPVLGVEYQQDDYSLTDDYFRKMGLQVRYFLPPGGVAPLAFYFSGDLLGDYSDLQLAGTVSVMETFQKIYRPEIYNSHTPAGEVFQPSLDHRDFTPTTVTYDRVERSELAAKQGAFTREHLIEPYGERLEQWAARYPVLVG